MASLTVENSDENNNNNNNNNGDENADRCQQPSQTTDPNPDDPEGPPRPNQISNPTKTKTKKAKIQAKLWKRLKSVSSVFGRTGKQALPFGLLIGPLEPFPTHAVYFGKCSDSGNASFSSSFYYTATVLSSIGYGDIVPCTWLGKLITLVLALTGVPLTLLCLGRLGHFMRLLLDKIWLDYFRRLICFRRRSRKKSVNQKEEGEEGGNEGRLPLAVGLGMTIVWVLVSSVYFHKFLYEDDRTPMSWNFFDALYFTVISMLTIGFGDYAPARRGLDSVTFAFIFVGLALVSMCVSIAQKRMESHFDKIVSMIHKVYSETANGKLKFNLDKNGKPDLSGMEKLNSDQSKVAAVVLEMWNTDPTGAWLNPLMENKGVNGDNDNKSAAPMRVGRFAQGAIFNKWKQKAIVSHHSISCQVEPADLLMLPTNPAAHHDIKNDVNDVDQTEGEHNKENLSERTVGGEPSRIRWENEVTVVTSIPTISHNNNNNVNFTFMAAPAVPQATPTSHPTITQAAAAKLNIIDGKNNSRQNATPLNSIKSSNPHHSNNNTTSSNNNYTNSITSKGPPKQRLTVIPLDGITTDDEVEDDQSAAMSKSKQKKPNPLKTNSNDNLRLIQPNNYYNMNNGNYDIHNNPTFVFVSSLADDV